jgi:hypothetical protein
MFLFLFFFNIFDDLIISSVFKSHPMVTHKFSFSLSLFVFSSLARSVPPRKEEKKKSKNRMIYSKKNVTELRKLFDKQAANGDQYTNKNRSTGSDLISNHTNETGRHQENINEPIINRTDSNHGMGEGEICFQAKTFVLIAEKKIKPFSLIQECQTSEIESVGVLCTPYEQLSMY